MQKAIDLKAQSYESVEVSQKISLVRIPLSEFRRENLSSVKKIMEKVTALQFYIGQGTTAHARF